MHQLREGEETFERCCSVCYRILCAPWLGNCVSLYGDAATCAGHSNIEPAGND